MGGGQLVVARPADEEESEPVVPVIDVPRVGAVDRQRRETRFGYDLRDIIQIEEHRLKNAKGIYLVAS